MMSCPMGNDRPPARPPGKPGIVRPLSSLKVSARPLGKRSPLGSDPIEPARRAEPTAQASIEPTLLLVGADDKFAPALRVALSRHRMYVETAEISDVADTVVVTAPDLVLLAGAAARDGGAAVLEKLASSPATSVVPVAILDDNTALDVRLRAFRHGAVAVIPRSASIDAIADEVARLAREIPERGGAALGVVGEATLAEFVSALGKELRSGILSLKSEGSEAPVRLVLGSGRPLAEFIQEFVQRVRGHVVKAEPLEYEFDGRATGTVQLLGAEFGAELGLENDAVPGSVGGLRVALADDDPARADVIAQELRARGATVVVIDLTPTDLQFSRLRQIDPEVLLIGEDHLQGQGYDLIRQMRGDTRLRWASLLVVRWDEVWSEQVKVPAIDRLIRALRALTDGDRVLRERVEAGVAFDTRLEVTGPARCLRAIASSSRSLRVNVFNPRVRIAIDLSEGLVAGATAEPVGPDRPAKVDDQWDGTSALAALLVLSSGRVHVEPVQTPAATNVMATIDVALSLADQETPPIAPSIPATTGSSYPPPAESVPKPLTPAPILATGIRIVERDRPPPPPPPPSEETPVSSNAFVPVGVTPAGAFQAVPMPPPADAADPFAAVPKPPTVPPPAPSAGPPAPTHGGAQPGAQVSASTLAARSNAALRRPGISRPIVTILVVLGALQGALIPLAYWWFTRSGTKETGKAVASAVASVAAVAASPDSALPTPSAVQSAPVVTPLPTLAESAPAVPAEPASGVDESGNQAPDCDEVLEGQRLPDGDFPGAAYEQQRMAEKSLVRGNVDEAELSYCKAVRWDKGNVARYIDVAQLMIIRRDGARTAEWAKRALEVNPGNTRAYGLLGDGLARIGEVHGAEQAWFAAVGTV
ncbi:MAG TPA: hypothetical protein VGP93_08735, partial [Polyangiaceae bacterium]|nr:hypothetical protein [Polyangiaceae bacterium]